ncbi:MAG: peroxide stress protein YaaA [Burkholderiaceae bacterium]|nr:peroxide stress protein YaaA [Burkholderiaceae bacterium]
MLIVLSPAKSLDYATPANTEKFTQPAFMRQASELAGILRQHSPAQLASLMKISDALAAQNVGRYASWQPECTLENAKQAVLAFVGDVYQGLDASSLTTAQLDWLQAHVRILSGLYGVLRPLDLMQPYRLEMGIKLANPHGRDLYAYWGERVTQALNEALRQCRAQTLVNLASEEYFKAVRPALFDVQVITPVFQDWNGGKFKLVPFHAKRARGLMARYAALHALRRVDELKEFDLDGYAFEEAVSAEDRWVFRRTKL